MNWKRWWKKDEEQRGEWNPREQMMPGIPEIPTPSQFDVPQRFVLPGWLEVILKRVFERFDPDNMPEGWTVEAFQTRGEYFVVLVGPMLSRTPFGEPIQMRHEIVFDKYAIKQSSEEVAEWTIYKALEEIFGLIGETGPFPPELEEMR